MAQLHYVNGGTNITRVKLGRDTVGTIYETASGFRYFPEGGVPGPFFSSLDACKESLSGMAKMEWAEGMQILREWRVFAPALVLHAGRWYIFSRTALQSSGATIEDALRAGGYLPRRDNVSPLLYVAIENAVKLGEGPDARLIAVADSGTSAEAASRTLAKRIANALNEYIPGDRGF